MNRIHFDWIEPFLHRLGEVSGFVVTELSIGCLRSLPPGLPSHKFSGIKRDLTLRVFRLKPRVFLRSSNRSR